MPIGKIFSTKFINTSASIANNPNATTPPTTTDDNSKGYSAKGGSTWTQIDGENAITYNCVDDTKDAAVWVNTSSMFVFDDWTSFVTAITVDDGTYVGKYVVVLNAIGGVPEGVTYTAPNTISSPITDNGSATYKVISQGSTWSVICKQHDEVASNAGYAVDIVGKVIDFAGFTLPSGYLWARGQAIPRATYSNLMKALSIELTSVATTYMSYTVKVSDTSNLQAGQAIECANLPSGTVVASILDATHITVSKTAIGTMSSGIARVFPHGNGDGVNTFNVANRVGRTAIGAGKASYSVTVPSSSINVSLNQITVPYNNTLITGTLVKYTATGTAIGGLTSGYNYYVFRISATAITLVTNADNAVWALNAVDLTTQGTLNHTFEVIGYTDRKVGEVCGEENHLSTVAETAKHSHSISNATAMNVGTMGTQTDCADNIGGNTGQTGGSMPHNNMQPTVVTNYIIKY